MERWVLSGSRRIEYEVGIDQAYHGQPSGFIRCKVEQPTGFGTLMQTFKADAYHGKRMRLSAMVRTEDVGAWAGLWMRVDGPNSTTLTFDNMKERPIQGTTDWQEYAVVLDVAAEAITIAFGVIVSGSGQAWIADVRFEEVNAAVLVTATRSGGQYKDAPGNLDFSEG